MTLRLRLNQCLNKYIHDTYILMKVFSVFLSVTINILYRLKLEDEFFFTIIMVGDTIRCFLDQLWCKLCTINV